MRARSGIKKIYFISYCNFYLGSCSGHQCKYYGTCEIIKYAQINIDIHLNDLLVYIVFDAGMLI